MNMIRYAAAGLALGLLAGCSSQAASHKALPAAAASATSASAAPASPSPGPAAYIAAVRQAGAGNKDLSGQHAEKVLLHIGRIVCDGLDTDLSYADELSAVSQSNSKITVTQATVLVNAAIRNLCPNHDSEIPDGGQ